MTYKIGTRVRKVRGNANIGRNGLVVTVPWYYQIFIGDGYDMAVLNDCSWENESGFVSPAGTISIDKSTLWEPIIPSGHRAGEQGTCDELDSLLSRATDGVVS
jgi:hypothetical protein